MEKAFLDLLKKKAGEQAKKPVNPKQIEAKKAVIQGIMEMLKGDMAGQLGGLKKVTIASPNQEGLEKGIDMAKGIVSKDPMDECEEDSEEESEESPDVEIAELEQKIAELKAAKGK